MQKIISLILVIFMSTFAFVGCGQSNLPEDGRLSVVTTIFPEYDWVMNILGENAENADVTLLLNSGVDLHSYQPTVNDIIKISTCDVFVYVGGESDKWVDDALKEAVNKDMVVINLLESIGDAAKEEEIVEGMQEDDHGNGDGPEYDEHVWLSVKNAAVICNVIKDVLCDVDTVNAEDYVANTETYIEKLDSLDNEYKRALDEASGKTILFCDRFPFRYLADDYGLSYYAAFEGCSAETEASFETVLFLANKVDELGLPCVLTLDGSDKRIAETVVSVTQAKSADILTLDSMQSITSADVKKGASYIAIMEKNLEVLKEALQ